MTRPLILDVLADRYASQAMLHIWEPMAKIMMERELWIVVLRAQMKAGLKTITADAIAAYEQAMNDVDLARIREIESETKHDVLARIQQFNEAASKRASKELQLIHTGMTSRDLTENVEQMQIRKSMQLVHNKVIAVLTRLTSCAGLYDHLPMVGRSHNVAAQMTTVGKRFATFAEELWHAYGRLQYSMATYSLRGIKGPVGTQQDMLDLLKRPEKVAELERTIMSHLGFENRFTSVGQVYPRSLDFEVISALVQVAAVGSSFATTLRLMAGNGLVTEGFSEKQGGSSAMPHKMNARSSERICGFYANLTGYLNQITVGAAGNQWNEGDVSCSVIRRVAVQSSFLTIDGLLETWLHVLDDFGVFEEAINSEVERYLPLVSTTKLMMAAVKAGMGRENAHEVLRVHGTAVARGQTADLLAALAEDPEWPINEVTAMETIIGRPDDLIGLAQAQTEEVIRMVGELLDEYPEACGYKPDPIL